MHLSDKKRNLNQLLAAVLTAIIALIFIAVVISVLERNPTAFAILMAIGAMTCYSTYNILTKKYRDRQELKKEPFPETWKTILEQYVAFYRALSEEEKRKFETEIQIFLHETRITGIKTEVDDVTMILAAASAEIPVFSFPEWEYPNLGEILIYPNAFDKEFRTEGEGRNIHGMVGTGAMNGIMILSKPALIAGFKNDQDKFNVGIHEFAHLLDAADGRYDGIPSLFLENSYIEPWLEVMHKETKRIEAGHSKMNAYGGTSKIEFFAVATEYFFEHPQALKNNKPELYELMTKIFQQDTKNRLTNAVRSLFNYTGQKVGRNQDCPCNSGKKYKRCCLKNAREY